MTTDYERGYRDGVEACRIKLIESEAGEYAAAAPLFRSGLIMAKSILRSLLIPTVPPTRCPVCLDSGYFTTDPKEPNPECSSCDYWERKATIPPTKEGT